MDQVFAEHDRQELRLALSVAVLARDRSAVRNHQVGRVGDEAAVLDDPLARFEIELDTSVHAALPEVAVQRALEAVPIEQLAELAQIAAHPFRRDGGILPAL